MKAPSLSTECQFILTHPQICACPCKPSKKSTIPAGCDDDSGDEDFRTGSEVSESDDDGKNDIVSNSELADSLPSKTISATGHYFMKQKQGFTRVEEVEDIDSAQNIRERSKTPTGSSILEPDEDECHSQAKKPRTVNLVKTLKDALSLMHTFYLLLKDRGTNEPITKEEINIASRKTLFDSQKTTEFISKLKEKANSIKKAVQKQQKVAEEPWNQEKFEELLTKWIVTSDMPFDDFCELVGKHSGENMAEAILALMLDNASNNDTLVDGIERCARAAGIHFRGAWAWLWCMPHVVHLSAIQLLMSIGALSSIEAKKAQSQTGNYQDAITTPLTSSTNNGDDPAATQNDQGDEGKQVLQPLAEFSDDIFTAVDKLWKIVRAVHFSPPQKQSWLCQVSEELFKDGTSKVKHALMLILDFPLSDKEVKEHEDAIEEWLQKEAMSMVNPSMFHQVKGKPTVATVWKKLTLIPSDKDAMYKSDLLAQLWNAHYVENGKINMRTHLTNMPLFTMLATSSCTSDKLTTSQDLIWHLTEKENSAVIKTNINC
ncbi:hypothetical protein C0995_003951 [Termitomyces sp. Mi166|nr:hypothetical protein C0995_003951 [Termitomyces sp. Mi166\